MPTLIVLSCVCWCVCMCVVSFLCICIVVCVYVCGFKFVYSCTRVCVFSLALLFYRTVLFGIYVYPIFEVLINGYIIGCFVVNLGRFVRYISWISSYIIHILIYIVLDKVCKLQAKAFGLFVSFFLLLGVYHIH